MKTVFFVRHAKSSWKDATLDDRERPLNRRGERDAPFMANMLRGRNVKPDRLVSSPAARALSTARYFAEALGIDPGRIEIDPGIYEGYPEDLLEIVRNFPRGASTVLLFGHNPALTSLANEFTENYIANIPTCGIVRVDAEVDDWREFGPKTGRVSAQFFPKELLR